MANYSADTIIAFLIEMSGIDDLSPESDIHDDLAMSGDDFDDMLTAYSKTYSVDMTDYLWYFHTEEEGWGSIGGSIFGPPNKLVKRIPITPIILTEFANSGKWNIKYPDHKVPKKRYDLIINQVILVGFLLLLVIWGVQRLMTYV